ncbi:MAG: T9SS type A sorting domain-containing protein [Salinibacter sp.]
MLVRYLRYLVPLVLLLPAGALAQAPKDLSASGEDGTVALTWTAPDIGDEEEVLCYGLYRDTTSIPDTNPEDVSNLRIADVLPSESGSPSYTDSTVTNGVEYFYRVMVETAETEESGVTCGGAEAERSSFSNQASAIPAAPVSMEIAQPEVPVSDPVPAGTSVDVVVEATNVPSDESVQLHFRRGGASSFRSRTMTREEATFTTTIPGAEVTKRGLELFVTTRNGRGDSVRTPSQGVASVRVEVPAEALAFSQAGGTYQIVSVPTRQDDRRLSALFSNLAPYDPAQWRLFSMNEAATGYRERTDLSTELPEGRGIWLITRGKTTLTPGPGTSVRTDRPYEIPLEAGWNLIGNPFAFEVPVSQVRATNTAASVQDLFGYTDTFVRKQDGDVLAPFRGYLVRLTGGQSGTLVIDPSRSTGPTAAPKRSPARSAWTVRVSAQAGETRDPHNVLGAAPTARRAVEARDGREPPPIGESVSFAFQAPTDQDAALWRDLRPANGSLRRWDAHVRTGRSGRVVLRVSGLASVPDDLAVWLVDPALDVRRNLRETPRYAFVTSGNETPHRLRVLVGPPAEVHSALGEAPDRAQRVRLRPVVPNPVRTHATLRYAVPKPTRVTLALYDILGRRVATLVDGRRVDAGTHSTVWAAPSGGEGLSSGTYLLRLRAGAETRTRRLVVTQ